MAITTIDGIIAGLQPPVNYYKQGTTVVAFRFFSHWYHPGMPSSGETITSGLAGNTLSGQTQGQISFSNPASGNTYLARFTANATQVGTCYLCDRLWHNSGIVVTSTSVQTINSPQFPPRDVTGGTSGSSILIGVEVSRPMGAGTPTFTMNYTATDGTTATTTTAAVTSAMEMGSFIQIPLVSGHTGVQKVNWWQQSATMTSGAYSLVAYRILTTIDCPVASVTSTKDIISTGMPRLYDNTVPFILYFATTVTAPIINCQIIYTQG